MVPHRHGGVLLAVMVLVGCGAETTYLSVADIEHTGPAEAALAEAGYAVWSIEYRLVGDPGAEWPNTFLDVAAGSDFLRELDGAEFVGRGTLDLDLEHLIAVGHSAGGNFVLWLAARPGLDPSSELFSETPIPIHGVLGLTPAPDLGRLAEEGDCQGAVAETMGGLPADVPDRYQVASPMTLKPVGVPQEVVIGRHDTYAPLGRAYYDAASAEGRSPLRLTEAPESGHFEVIDPSSTTWSVVLEALGRLDSEIRN